MNRLNVDTGLNTLSSAHLHTLRLSELRETLTFHILLDSIDYHAMHESVNESVSFIFLGHYTNCTFHDIENTHNRINAKSTFKVMYKTSPIPQPFLSKVYRCLLDVSQISLDT